MKNKASKKLVLKCGVLGRAIEGLNDALYGKVNACYVISKLNPQAGMTWRSSVDIFKAATRPGQASGKAARFACNLISKGGYTLDTLGEIRVYFERYAIIAAESGIKVNTDYRPKTFICIDRTRENSEKQAEINEIAGINF